jgi:glycosyltransferase involved in cell wall biosynthesis
VTLPSLTRLPAADAANVGRTPLITFGIPAYNRPHLLAETLASIAGQTAAVDYEVIVCDDGGLPETAATVGRFDANRFFYHRNPVPLGAVRNWNECLRRARGRWVMILHEDDALYPWYLALVLPHLRDQLAAICTRTSVGPTMPVRPAPTGRSRGNAYRPALFLSSSMSPFPGVLFPRELGLSLGGFDERAGPLADYDFWYRLACTGRIERIREVGAFYRVADDQWTARAWPVMLRKVHLLRLRIARDQIRSPRLGRWLARFFTYRTALAYARRFPEKPAGLARALRFRKILFSRLPSGWVWRCLKLFA